MLTTVRRIARLPVLLVEAAQATSDTARRLPALRRAVTERVASVDRSLREVLDLLSSIAGDVERTRETIEPQREQVGAIEASVARLETRLAGLQAALGALQRNVEAAAEQLPDPDAPGPLARARDTLAGRS